MSWIGDWFRRRQIDRDLADEIQGHLEESVERLIAQGLPRAEALRAARREFGNATYFEERGREVWRWQLVEEWIADLRFALRQLRKAPVFAAGAILTLALGIGANTAVFSVVNAVILRPLPFPEPDRLVSVQTAGDEHGGPQSLSYPAFFDFRNQNHVFDHIVCYRDTDLGLSGNGVATNLPGQIVSWDLLDALHVRPVAGRGFLPEEEKGGTRVVLLSHRLWTVRFGADPSIVGHSILLNDQPFTVVGVAPPGFNFPIGGRQVEIWTTLALDNFKPTADSTPVTEQRGARMLDTVARLKPGVSLERARAEMDAIAAALARQYPDSHKRARRAWIYPEVERVVGPTHDPIIYLLCAVGLVLLVACANLANLLLARTSERQREFALRASIGASRGRLVRQLLVEGLVLAAGGAAAGILVAGKTIGAIARLAADNIPRIEEASVDGRVLAFSLALTLAATLLFSLAPGLRVARSGLIAPLKESSAGGVGGRDRLRNLLVVFQVAFGLILVSAAALSGGGFVHLMRRDSGFRAQGLVSFDVSLPVSVQDRHFDFENRLMDRLMHLPGISSVATAFPLPLAGSQMTIGFNIEERPSAPSERLFADMAFVSVDYFKTIGVPVLEGRTFTDADDGKAPPVLVVNRAFADKYFPGERVIGKRMEPGATATGVRGGMREIVGLVGDARQRPGGNEPDPIYYFAARQLPWCCGSYVVRTSGPPVALESAIRGVVASLDDRDPVYHVKTFEDALSEGIAGQRFLALLLGAFAMIALVLTTVGLYAVLTYSVLARTREIGVRVALGARRADVVRMVLREAGALVSAGVAIGLAGTLAVNQLAAKMMPGEVPRTALLALACGVIVCAAAFAAWLPASRAASVDPMGALRNE